MRGELDYDMFSLHLGMTSVYLHRISSWRGDRSAMQPRTLSLTHLELRNCRIAPGELRRILLAPIALKTFVYEIGEACRGEYGLHISYRSVRKALEPQKESLEQVWIDYPHDYTFDEFPEEDTRAMGSFSAFTKLRYLRIASTFLFGYVWSEDVDTKRLVRALPEQIEEVHLSHADEDEETLEGVYLVLTAKQYGRFDMLRDLKLDGPMRVCNSYASPSTILGPSEVKKPFTIRDPCKLSLAG